MSDIKGKDSFFGGTSGTRLIQGLVVGVAATLIVGFGFSDWNLASAVETKVEVATHDATIAALAPICAERFETAATADPAIVETLKAINSWSRNEHLMKGGFATFAGGAEPDYMVARDCATRIATAHKFE